MSRLASAGICITNEEALLLAKKAGAMFALRPMPRVVVSKEKISPVACGILRPTVVLPAEVAEKVCAEELFAVLAHEFAHLRRRDPLVGWVLAVCEALYFFHPILYLAKRRALFERERACDDWVVAAGKAKPSTYANALVSAAEICRTFRSRVGPVGVVAESFTDLKKRLVAIGSHLKPKARLSLTAVIVLVIIGGICAPGIILTARTESEPEAGKQATANPSERDTEKAAPAGNGAAGRTMPKQVSVGEFLKDWPGQGTMGLRAEPATVAQRQQAGMTGTTIGTVVSTVREGPAREVGLQAGDFVVRVAGIDVRSQHHLIALTRAMAPGTKVNVEFVRWGEKMSVDVVLDRLTWEDDCPILAGSVHLPNGQPAAGAMVYASVFYDREWISIALPYLTDVRGRFIAKFSQRAEPGRCFLLATTYDGYAGHAIVDFPIKAPIEIGLEKGKVTEGRLYTDKGEGLPDIFMEVGRITIPGIEGDFRAVCELRTDDNGSFVLPALPVGSKVELDFAVPGYARPGRGPYDLSRLQKGLLFGKDAIPPGAVIEGVVIASDTGVPLGPFSLSWRNESAKVSESIQVDVLGRFKADTLPAGQTSLYIDVSETRDLGYTLKQKMLDLQPGGEVTGLRLTAEPFSVVTGKVADRATKTGLAGFTVKAWSDTIPVAVFDTTTDVDGTYRLAIPAGNIMFSLPASRGKQIRTEPGQMINNVDFVAKAPSEDKITLRILGPNGRPVSRAKVGQRMSEREDTQNWSFGASDYVLSDEKGIVVFRKDDLFTGQQEDKKALLLYGLEPSQGLAGFTEVSQEGRDHVIDWHFQPVCRVYGQLQSTALEKLGQYPKRTNVALYRDKYRPLSYSSAMRRYEFLLPPGRYTLRADGISTYTVTREIEIAPTQQELLLNFDLPADKVATLRGKAAPELSNIKGWINTEPLKLPDLRGKVILLDFWGYWCNPCVAGMPKLMDLHQRFSKHGLVIIGVHDDSLDSVEDVKEKLEVLSEKRWQGRKIHFAVALDGGGSKGIEGTDMSVRGATTAAYGINAWPTYVLIGKNGQVIGKADPGKPKLITVLQRMLNIERH
jgi:thiol-disulfide isomerase/thioredoxin